MCGRFVREKTVEELAADFGIEDHSVEIAPSYNIAPTQPVLMVVNDGGKRFALARWGLIPSWSKDEKIGSNLINARAESLLEKPSFKTPFKRQRCLVVADGFYEWRKIGAAKQPIFIRLKSGRAFGFAGLYDRWHSPAGEEITSCTIITTEPNDLMQQIHNRMPVIIPKRAEDTWIDPGVGDAATLFDLLQPYPAAEMQAYPVSRAINSPAHNLPDCIKPLSQ